MRVLLLVLAVPVGVLLGAAGLLGLGFLLDGPSPPLEQSDAIVVISGDEELARFREGLRLYQAGWAPILVFSGAARDDSVSNAQIMREIAVQAGVPAESILVDHDGVDTFGNARHTRELMELHGLQSAILVTSPYHVRRAHLTFLAAYDGSGIRVLPHAAPDSEWRKLTWWLYPHTRHLTILELEKLAYIAITGRYR